MRNKLMLLAAGLMVIALVIAGRHLVRDPAMRGRLPHHVEFQRTAAALDRYTPVIQDTVAKGGSLEALYGTSPAMDQVIERLALGPDDVLADVGSGTGRLEVALLERGVPFGRIYALEINSVPHILMSRVIQEAGFTGGERVVPVVSAPRDTLLEPSSVDVGLLLTTPIYLDNPHDPHMAADGKQCMVSLTRAIRPGGRLHVFEYTFKLPAVEGQSRCQSLVDIIEPLGYRAVDQELLLMEWWAPRFTKHCWVEFQKLP